MKQLRIARLSSFTPGPVGSLLRPWLLATCLIGALATPWTAWAADSDGDSCDDSIDAYPYDYTRCAAATGILATYNGDSASDNFGYAVRHAGDVNNDGYADVIVGAPYDDNNGTDSGSARVISGANGAILYTFNGDGANDYFGYAVSGAGDVNNDGYDDLIVGAYADDNTGLNSGSARVISGANGAILYTFNGDSASDSFGVAVSGAGDVNNDGYDDVIVGALLDDNMGTDSGSARVFSGANGAVLYTFNGDGINDYFGRSVSGAGDVNNDGYADLIVGASHDDNTGTDSGSGRIFSGADGATLYTFNGDSTGDYFGYSVSAAGDVNNDGFGDVIVGAYGDDNNARIDSGSARVFSGANGAILYTFDGDSAGDALGISVSGAGDVDNDGKDDLIVGAYFDDNNGSNSGMARVYSGANGGILFTFNGDSGADYFGVAVSGAGDVNNDGYADLIVGSYGDDNTGSSAGSARVFSGKAGLTDFDGDGNKDATDTDDDNDGVLDINDLDPRNALKTTDADLDGVDALVDNCATTYNPDQANNDGDAQGNACDADDDNDGVADSADSYPLNATRATGDTGIFHTLNGDSASDALGRSVSGAGDVNNDGFDDVIVGMPYDDNNGRSNSGSARVYSGATGATLYTFNGDSVGDNLGFAVGAAGDVNNDGYDDLIVGAYLDDNTGTDSGSARVYSGANGAILYTFNGDGAYDYFGYAVSGAGDVDGDGRADLLVGAYADDNNGTDSGSARIFSGANGAILYTFNGDGVYDYFGRSVSAAGDVNNDGKADVIVGANSDDNNGVDSGSARVFSGANGTILYTFNGDSAGDYLGISVAAAGDVNNDGYDDLIAGALQDDNTAMDSGSARVFSGANGTVLYTFNGDGVSDYFGIAVSGAGDVNNDGYADVIIGAYGDDNSGSNAGSARVHSGADGSILFVLNGDSSSDYAGYAVAGAGDINNDGYDDLIVGAHYDDNTASDAGSARLYSGRAASADWDGDGTVDALDTNDDNDAMPDISDSTPMGDRLDTDLDGTGNAFDLDDDGDQVADTADNCPLQANADQANLDGDAEGDVCDADDDGDGVLDSVDLFPLDASETADWDADGIGNNADTDDDNDSVADSVDNCPLVANTDQANVDGDSLGNACDLDNDNDGVNDTDDNCPTVSNPFQQDSDGDGTGNYCDATPFPESGSVNGDFNPGQGANGTVWATAEQADGKFIIGGEFSSYDGVSRNRIVRVNANGSLDTTFNPGTGVTGDYVNMVAVQGDGKIVIVGLFTHFNGAARANIARLNTNGSLDTTFAATAANGPVYAVAVQADGKIVIGGDFTTVGGYNYDRVARLNANGSVDTSFANPAVPPAWVAALGLQPDGKIIIGGAFTGLPGTNSWGIARLNANGTVDTSFAAGIGLNQAIYALAIQPDGKILAGGGFTLFDNATANMIVRLNADGSRDSSFDTGAGIAGSFVYTIAARHNKIVLGGGFSSYDGVARNHVVRLNSDGSLDTGFNQSGGASDMVYASVISASGDLLIGGAFTSYNGIARNRVALIVAYADSDGDGLDNGIDNDDDNDGTDDVQDNCYLIPNADQANADNDMFGDACDEDDDNDGLLDGGDNCPLHANASQADNDGDGQGDACDNDDDNDTVEDASDNCPMLANTGQGNIDGDALGDACDDDQDGDTVANADDNCPALANADQKDTDGDGTGNVCDSTLYGDVDFDGIGDLEDNCPAIANPGQEDVDSDNLGNACDADQGGVVAVMTPGQKVYASGGEVVVKVLPSDAGYTSELWLDQPAPARFIALNRDAGTIVNLGTFTAGQELVFRIYVRDTNRNFYTGPASRNGDNKLHAAANLPAIGPATVGFEDVWNGGDQDFNDNMFRFLGLSGFVDTDGDGVGNYYDSDDDNDGVLDVDDAFPEDASETVDTDSDGIGNNADTDDDNDGVVDAEDLFPLDGTEWSDTDGDGTGDNADPSDDGDSIDDTVDNCPTVVNDDQADNDSDGLGDVCDTDDDNDTVSDEADNCPLHANTNQYDGDGDGLGNPCDATPYPQAGSLDAAFNTGTGFNGIVWATEVQPDGKAVIGGEFSAYNGVGRNRIARLNSNGSLDTTFNPGTGVNGAYVNMLALQADGKIVIGGLFSDYNGVVRNNVARLHANGSLDTAFNPSGGVNGPVYAVAVQADGKVIIGGDFTQVGGLSYSKLARLNSDGSVDTGFVNPDLGGAWVAALAVQPDGKLLIAGYFTKTGMDAAGILRLNTDGTVDTGFDPGTGVDNAIYSLALQADGKVVIGGGFATFNGMTANRVARLNADGSLDTGFATAAGLGVSGLHVYSVALAGNKLIIGGSFSAYNSLSTNNIARLNNDGSLDTDFQSGTGANDAIYASRMQPNGDIIVGGQFTAYNGVTANHVARLNGVIDSDGDGIIDAADIDDDNDGLEDEVDNCPAIANSNQANMDRDTWGDACDADDDNDGIEDADDAFPLDMSESVDTDLDGIGNNADTDDDGDGLADTDETAYGLDPLDTDSDDDGVSDGDEVLVYGSNPLATDSDGDGMPDGYEVSKGLDPANADDDLLDADGDGWTNKQEYDRGSDPVDAGSKPIAAPNPISGTIRQPTAVTQNTLGMWSSSYPITKTFDQSGLTPKFQNGAVNFASYMALNPVHVTGSSDSWFAQSGTLAGTIDYDLGQSGLIRKLVIWSGQDASAQLNQAMKDFKVYTSQTASFTTSVQVGTFTLSNTAQTAAQVFDITDSAGRYVRLQVLNNWGSSTVLGFGEIAFDMGDDTSDADGDGMPDYWETQYGLNQDLASDAVADLDADGLINLQEYIHGTNPTVADTDGDGWNDGREVNVERSNPKVADPVDSDSDGVLDINDKFPNDASEWLDTDNDGTGNNADTDDDNDTVADLSDNCPLNANTDQLNTDGDSQGNACDADDDNDGVPDASDQLPLKAGVSVDADADGFGDSWIPTCDTACQLASGTTLDNCPGLTNPDQLNTDGDSQGNACDTDDDNDGVPDVSDRFPLDASEWGDTDNDGIGNNSDPDDDNDGLTDVMEASLGTAANRADSDYDGLSDYAEVMTHASNPLSIDSDGDIMADGWEVSYGLNLNSAGDAAADLDGDGLSNVNEYIAGTNPTVTDSDSDTLLDGADNCPAVSNVGQADYDSNGIGDACDDKSGLVSAGGNHTCAVTPAGAAKCWGYNSYYQLGDGTSSQRLYPTQVSGLASEVVAVASGDNHSCALTSTGAVKCWGYNSYGQLGNGTYTYALTPVQVTGLDSGVKAITAGANHTCALKLDKSVLCWGRNYAGQIGNNSSTDVLVPVVVTGVTAATSVSAGANHTCAVTAGGAMCWGFNSNGELGDGSNLNRSAPVSVSGLVSGVARVTTGSNHSCATLTDGSIKCWGSNSYGQLGNNSSTNSLVPVSVSGIGSGNLAADAGSAHTCAVSTVGAVQCWGYNYYGQLGNNSSTTSTVPVNVSGISSGTVAVSAGSWHSCAMSSSGTLKCWGNNSNGQLGNNSTSTQYGPVNTPFMLTQSITITGAVPASIAQGSSFTVAATSTSGLAVSITASGACTLSGNTVTASNVVGTCQVSYNQAGNGDVNPATTVTSSTSVYDPDLDDDGVLNEYDAFPNNPAEWLDSDGDGIGNNADTDDDNDTVADGSDNCPYIANSNQADSNGNGVGDLCDNPAGRIATGTSHSCAISNTGGLSCWGSNGDGQLGDGSFTTRYTPVSVNLGAMAQSVAAGETNTCALTTSGAVKCWGYNYYGQAGDGTTTTRNTPVQVTGLTSGVKAISVGGLHACALKADGQVACWGYNGHGQLGNGTTTTSYTPVTVSGLTGVTAIVSGRYHNCALTSAGAMKCWGVNNNGELGNSVTGNAFTPVQVTGLTSGVSAISAAWYGSCAVTTGGALKCWGDNYNAQLGDGTFTDRNSPVQVTGLTSGIASSEGGYYHNCAVNTAGAASCWGYNYYGALGDNSSTTRSTPVAVSGLASGVAAVSGGAYHSCALLNTGAVKCWGYNYYGQLGDNTTTTRYAPVSVVVPQTQSITVTQAAPASAGYGTSFTVAATASSGLPVTVTTSGGCANSGNTVTMNSASTACTVSYSQSGNTTYMAAPTVSSTTTATKGNQVITVTQAAPATAPLGGTFNVAATSNSGLTVAIATSGGCTIAGNTVTLTALSNCTVTYAQPGNTNYNAASNVSSVTTVYNPDRDGDGVANEIDAFPDNAAEWLDTDGDGTGNNADTDDDNDGLADGSDNCPQASNADQLDSDSNGTGDACEAKAGRLATGTGHSCAITQAGGVRCWGYNGSGQLGNASFISSQVPVQVYGLTSGIKAVTAGDSHSCALTTAGAVQCWGYNATGALGNGGTSNQAAPVQVSGLSSGVVAIAAGYSSTCALLDTGIVKCWGSNNYGQLGDGSGTGRTTPVTVSGLTGAIDLAAGAYHACAVTASGTVQCWGYNNNGQLGNNTSTNSLVPVAVSGMTSARAIAAGWYHSCAISSSNALSCWGSNTYGQLGDGTTTGKTVPAAVSGMGSGVKSVDGGLYHTCAAKADGAVSCWGVNGYGQLGDNTNNTRSTPVAVSGLAAGSGSQVVSAGYYQSCAMRSSGQVMCWGYNNYGQLGDNSTTNRSVPVSVHGWTPQVITVSTPAPAVAAPGATFTVVATASSGLPVQIAVGGCTLSGTTVTMGSSDCAVIYSQPGDAVYQPAVTQFSNTRLDSDGDGVADSDDTFPADGTEWLDTDSDGIGNNADTDDDNDGRLDELDAAPLDPAVQDAKYPLNGIYKGSFIRDGAGLQ